MNPENVNAKQETLKSKICNQREKKSQSQLPQDAVMSRANKLKHVQEATP